MQGKDNRYDAREGEFLINEGATAQRVLTYCTDHAAGRLLSDGSGYHIIERAGHDPIALDSDELTALRDLFNDALND